MKKIISRAPLRISLAGGGTDQDFFYKNYLGHVLSVTINLFTYSEILKSDSSVLTVSDFGKSMVITDLNVIPKDRELILPFLTFKKICEKFNDGKLLLVSLNTLSEVSSGSGLGASSALVVSIINGFNEFLKLSLTPKLIAELAYEIERVDAKMSGGKQDHYAAAYGGINYYQFKQNGEVFVDSLRIKKYILNEIESSMILVNISSFRKNIKKVHFLNEDVMIRTYQNISDYVFKIRDALLTGDFKSLIKYIKKSSKLKNEISDITNFEPIIRLIEFIDEISNKNELIGFCRICGSGESGYLLIYCDISIKNKIVKYVKNLNIDYIFPKITLNGPETWYE